MLQVGGRVHETPDTAGRTRHEDSPKKIQNWGGTWHI